MNCEQKLDAILADIQAMKADIIDIKATISTMDTTTGNIDLSSMENKINNIVTFLGVGI